MFSTLQIWVPAFRQTGPHMCITCARFDYMRLSLITCGHTLRSAPVAGGKQPITRRIRASRSAGSHARKWSSGRAVMTDVGSDTLNRGKHLSKSSQLGSIPLSAFFEPNPNSAELEKLAHQAQPSPKMVGTRPNVVERSKQMPNQARLYHSEPRCAEPNGS